MPCALLSSSCWISSGDQFARSRHRDRQDVVEARRAAAIASSLWRRDDIDLVIVHRVQRRRRRRGHPGGVGAGLRMARSSAPASRPSGRASPTCPCRSARGREARRRGRYRRSSPRRPGSRRCVRMSPLRIIGPASIEVWISSPVRSRKPVLMKNTRDLRGADALLEVDGGAPLLVHDADLEGVARQAEHVLDRGRTARWRRRPRRARASSA